MGMTKALQERVFIQGNMRCPQTRFICVRYGNVLASRGSVIPLFHDQIRGGGPVTITTTDMTRFLLSLDQAVDTIFAAVLGAGRGETYIPRVPSARVEDIATALIGDRAVEIRVTGIRPGEKIHEILVSEEERYRTMERGDYYAILPMLPELLGSTDVVAALDDEYSSARDVMAGEALLDVLRQHKLMIDDILPASGEILR
jgi:UDP-glucose 4-epimerase